MPTIKEIKERLGTIDDESSLFEELILDGRAYASSGYQQIQKTRTQKTSGRRFAFGKIAYEKNFILSD